MGKSKLNAGRKKAESVRRNVAPPETGTGTLPSKPLSLINIQIGRNG